MGYVLDAWIVEDVLRIEGTVSPSSSKGAGPVLAGCVVGKKVVVVGGGCFFSGGEAMVDVSCQNLSGSPQSYRLWLSANLCYSITCRARK